MRHVKATLSDAYKVHKTYTEYLMDHSRKEPQGLYQGWVMKLTSDLHKYHLLMHGKKVIGMVWGREINGEVTKTFLIEGVFLRRAFRHFKFKRELADIVKVMVKDFETILMLKVKKDAKLKTSGNILGVLVDISKRRA